MTKFNPYREADICCSLKVSFRYPSCVRVTLRYECNCDSLNRIMAPFWYPSGTLPACGRNGHSAT